MSLSARFRVAAAVVPGSPTLRLLALNEILRTFGRGAIAALLPLYLVEFGGLTASQVAFAAGVGGAIGMVGAIPSGRAIDLFGSKPVAVATKIGQGLAMIAMCWTSGFALVAGAFAVMIAFDTAAGAAGGALVAHALVGSERVAARAYLRTVSNIGMSVGIGCGGLALALDSQPVDQAVLVAAGLLTAASALAVWRLEASPRSTALADGETKPPATIAMRDGTFVVFIASFLVLTLNRAVLTLGLPLYLVVNTNLPTWLYSLLLMTNTALVILLQMRLSRRAEEPDGARTSIVQSGLLYAVAMVLLVGATFQSTLLSLVALVTFLVVLTVGEIFQAAGGWGLSYHLAPEHSHGAYQAIFATVGPASNVLGPILIGVVFIPSPSIGPLLFAAGFVIASWVLQSSSGLFARTRPTEERNLVS